MRRTFVGVHASGKTELNYVSGLAKSSHLLFTSIQPGNVVDNVIACGKYKYRVEATWRYGEGGMPDYATSQVMEQMTDSLKEVLKKDPVAILTGIYTGAGERNWVFYTMSLPIFGKKFNEAMRELPKIDLTFHAEEDAEWNEYAEMRQTEIAVDDEDR